MIHFLSWIGSPLGAARESVLLFYPVLLVVLVFSRFACMVLCVLLHVIPYIMAPN